jgi:hypothetical protein
MATRWHVRKLSEEDIEAINRHSSVIRAARRLGKAFEAITKWRLASAKSIPRQKFGLIVAYEDALGELKEAIIRATRKQVVKSRRVT